MDKEEIEKKLDYTFSILGDGWERNDDLMTIHKEIKQLLLATTSTTRPTEEESELKFRVKKTENMLAEFILIDSPTEEQCSEMISQVSEAIESEWLLSNGDSEGEEKIKIGDFEISTHPSENGKELIWIVNESGEGTTVDADQFNEFFKKVM